MPGGEGVLELPGEILFVVSAAGVTRAGAECLQSSWAWFIDRGIWRYREDGGAPILRTTYRLADLGDAACEVTATPDEVDVLLSPCHFTHGSLNGLQTAARASVRAGWTYHEPAARRHLAAS
jgi:hypothetical protein